MGSSNWRWAALFSVSVALGCGAPKNSSGSDGGTGGSSSSSSGSGSSGSGGNCTLPTTISTNMTLDSSCKPWHATSTVLVEGNAAPVLTIDPGVTVAFDQGCSLIIGADSAGGLLAAGTAASHITFTSSSAQPKAGDWGGIFFMDNASASSAVGYADFLYGSGQPNNTAGYNGPQGALTTQSQTANFQLLFHDLTFTHNGANGIVMNAFGVGFKTGSGNLTVNDWGTGSEPFVVASNQAGTLPASLTAPATSNGTPAVVDLIGGAGELGGGGGSSWVMTTQTWPATAIPYLLDGDTQGNGSNGVQSGINIEGLGSNTATLTIAAPNQIEFRNWGSIEVDPNGSAQGNLVANGTASAPIVFTSFSNPSSPASGSWSGIHFGVTTSGIAGSSLTNATIEGAGGNWTISSGQSGSIFLDGPTTQPATQAIGPTITGCTIKDYPTGSCGIIAGGMSPTMLTAYGTANTFGDLTSKVCGD